jgi:hypothetical protein
MKTKKIITAVSALALALSALPMNASAVDGFATFEEFEADLFARFDSGEQPYDADLDGDFDLDDPMAVLSYYAVFMMGSDGVYSENPDISEEVFNNVRDNFDLDKNGQTDANDAVYLLRYYYYGYKALEIGDVDGDGTITASDASEVLSFYADVQTGEELGFEVQSDMKYLGDVNSDDTTDATDASDILSIYAENMTKE